MGTSKGYEMPVGGVWTSVKRNATAFVQNNGSQKITPGSVVNDFLKASQSYSSQNRSGTKIGGKAKHRWHTAIKAGQGIASFLSDVNSKGIDYALKEKGLSYLIGKTSDEILPALLDALTGPANTLDDSAARTALSDLYRDLLNDAETTEEVEKILTKQINEDGLDLILAMFFAKYAYQMFCQTYYEDWRRKVGIDEAQNSLLEINSYIHSEVRSRYTRKKTENINWVTKDGSKMVEGIITDILIIFGVSL